MSHVRYMLWPEKEGLENYDTVLARGLTAVEAAKRICEHGGAKTLPVRPRIRRLP